MSRLVRDGTVEPDVSRGQIIRERGRHRKNIFSLFSCTQLSYTLLNESADNNNVSVQYNGRLLPDIILLTQCYNYHRGRGFEFAANDPT